MNISSDRGSLISFWHDLSILESAAELRAPVFQAVQTYHDIDADSDIGSSVTTEDISLCWFSDDEQVSVCVYQQFKNTFNLEKGYWELELGSTIDMCDSIDSS